MRRCLVVVCRGRRGFFLEFSKFLIDAAKGQPHNVEIAAFDSLYKSPAKPLNCVSSRLAERLPACYVIRNFRGAQIREVNAGYINEFACGAVGQTKKDDACVNVVH